MTYMFRVVFSGPCAYVPNIAEKDEGSAKSWSVVLPYLKNGWPGEKDGDGIPVDRHLAVVQLQVSKFNTSVPPDILTAVRNDQGIYQESGLYLLDGHRVTFDLPGAGTLKVVEHTVNPKVMSSQSAVQKLLEASDPRIKSMSWLPAMNWLHKDLRWFCNERISYFRDNGFPMKGSIAGHVLLKQGSLLAHEIDTVPTKAGPMVPTIWEFRPPKTCIDSRNHRQALAKSIALEAEIIDKPVTITIAYSPSVKTILSLKPEHCNGDIEIQIKNRELEEIFLPNTSEFEPQPVDLDFRYMYTQAKHYVPDAKNYPLPNRVEGGDGGNERGTCGGHAFSGFSQTYSTIVNSW